MKSALQGATETYFRNATAARRYGARDQYTTTSLVVASHESSVRVGRAALAVLREMRETPRPIEGDAA